MNEIININELFKYQLSWVLVPVLIIIWYLFPKTNYIFTVPMLCISIIGIIDSIFFHNLSLLLIILNIIGHIILLIPILIKTKLNINEIIKLFKFSKYTFILLIFANLIILKLPNWPYGITKKNMLFIYIFLHIFFWLFYIIYTYLFIKK